MKEAEKENITAELMRVIPQIQVNVPSELIPDDGMELVYAIPGARIPAEVASCIITLPHPGHNACPPVRFDCSTPMVSAILTALRFSPEIRCASGIRYSKGLRSIADSMLLETCTVRAEKIPKGVSTMDWAVAFCSEQESGVPDVLFIETDGKTPAQARLFGEKPGSVATNLIKIAQRIIDATH